MKKLNLKWYILGLYKKSEKTLVLKIKEDADEHGPDIYFWVGSMVTSKQYIKQVKHKILSEANHAMRTNFKHIIIE